MNKEEVLKIVDVCFHHFASGYRIEAKHKAIELIDKLHDVKGENLPIHNVSKRFEIDFEGAVLAYIEIANNEPIIHRAMNGYGIGVDPKKCKITQTN